MALVKILRLLPIVSLAILNFSFSALPVNALAVDHDHMGRDLVYAHPGLAKRHKHGKHSKQCRPRPAQSSPAPPTQPSPPQNHVSPMPQTSPASQPPSQTTAAPSTPSSTPSSSPSPPPSPPSSPVGGRKVGLAWSNNEQPALNHFVTSHTNIIFNWQLQKYATNDVNLADYPSLSFVPTVHGRDNVGSIASTLVPGYASYVRTFNEPEIPSQANMSPQEAYSLWMQYINALSHQGYQLLAPSVTTGSAGFNWLQQFLNLCKSGGCHIDKMDLHYYGTQASDFTSAADRFYSTFNLPTWFTEIGCHDYSQPGAGVQCNQQTFDAFFPAVISYCENTAHVEVYAWFGMFRADEMPNNVGPVNSMITCSNEGNPSTCYPNSLGYRYLNP
ncbi:glycosyl hydrolase catalytic core-domain-containing protein [Russula earlei]|uniref:Glycosyl hydrolase catalytic core-domain-containing protein n=1 Tax=Russula earlei TaxID=71964 RepID=A0ACC0UH72_9AGAM|nr:glycosyl hydrolase catalytic core-domain-containing protein [Russula earlei]